MFDQKEYMKQWRMDNPGYEKQWLMKHPGYRKQWRMNHPGCGKQWLMRHPGFMKQYYRDNRSHIAEQRRQRRKGDPALRKRQRKYCKQWAEDNPERIGEYTRRWQKKHPEWVREKRKRFYARHRAKEIERVGEWQKGNRDYMNLYVRNRYKTNLRFSLSLRMTTAIRKSLKGNKAGRHWEDLVGYTLEDLVKRLKRTMPEGYTWKDFLEGRLQVDHIIPKSAFNYTEPGHIDFQRCWALGNLRLLPAKENLEKYDRLERPFQPALTISV